MLTYYIFFLTAAASRRRISPSHSDTSGKNNSLKTPTAQIAKIVSIAHCIWVAFFNQPAQNVMICRNLSVCSPFSRPYKKVGLTKRTRKKKIPKRLCVRFASNCAYLVPVTNVERGATSEPAAGTDGTGGGGGATGGFPPPIKRMNHAPINCTARRRLLLAGPGRDVRFVSVKKTETHAEQDAGSRQRQIGGEGLSRLRGGEEAPQYPETREGTKNYPQSTYWILRRMVQHTHFSSLSPRFLSPQQQQQ